MGQTPQASILHAAGQFRIPPPGVWLYLQEIEIQTEEKGQTDIQTLRQISGDDMRVK